MTEEGPPPPEFVDSNVFLYAYDPTEGGRHEAARALLEDLWRRPAGALSVQVLQEFYVNATRRIAQPLDPDAATDRLRALARWQTHAPGAADVIAATAIHRRHKISFWDAMIVRSASALGCRVLWSEDLNPGQTYEGVEVRNPFA